MSHGLDLDAIAASLGNHSIFSPSGSAMWAYCSGSLIPNLLSPDSAGPEAAEGTIAHMVGETWLKEDRRPDHLVGTVHDVVEGDEVYHIEIDHAMLDYVEEYVNWCYALEGDHHIETKVYFSNLTPLERQGGTADHVVCGWQRMTITDLKYGKGIQVFAQDNTQAILYAYGFFREWDWLFDFQDIEIRICQPRLSHFDVWTITREELLDWADWLMERAFKAWIPNAPRTPGPKQCQWCRVKAGCSAFVAMQEKLSEGVFDDLVVTEAEMAEVKRKIETGTAAAMLCPDISSLTVEHKAKLLPFRRMVEQWWAAIHDDLEKRLLDGQEVPGYKLVDGRSSRLFSDEQEAAELLDFYGLDSDTIYPKKLVSPSQAEEALRKIGYKRAALPSMLKSVIAKRHSSLTMAPDSDRRMSAAQALDDVFGSFVDDL